MNTSNNICKGKKREEWLDALRALAICLVVFGHQYAGNVEFFVFTSPIKMPLFFILSGYLFSPKGFNTKDFLKNTFFRLVIPWLFFGLIFSILLIPLKGIGQFLYKILDIASGKELWFMPAFIIGQVIFYLINKYMKKEWLIFISCLIIGVFGLCCSYLHFLRFAMVDIALSAQLFFILGFFLKDNKCFLELKKSWIVVLAGLYLVFCVLTIFFWPGEAIDVHKGYYYNYGICFILIVIGCVAIMNIAKKIDHYPSLITIIGQHTLLIYILHFYTANAILRLFGLFDLPSKGHFVFALIATIFSVIVCTYVSIIISRYVPILNGTKKPNRR